MQADGIHPIASQTTGGNGPVTGQEIQCNLNFATPFSLAADLYFFVPQVDVTGAKDFLWLWRCGRSCRPVHLSLPICKAGPGINFSILTGCVSAQPSSAAPPSMPRSRCRVRPFRNPPAPSCWSRAWVCSLYGDANRSGTGRLLQLEALVAPAGGPIHWAGQAGALLPRTQATASHAGHSPIMACCYRTYGGAPTLPCRLPFSASVVCCGRLAGRSQNAPVRRFRCCNHPAITEA